MDTSIDGMWWNVVSYSSESEFYFKDETNLYPVHYDLVEALQVYTIMWLECYKKENVPR